MHMAMRMSRAGGMSQSRPIGKSRECVMPPQDKTKNRRNTGMNILQGEISRNTIYAPVTQMKYTFPDQVQ